MQFGISFSMHYYSNFMRNKYIKLKSLIFCIILFLINVGNVQAGILRHETVIDMIDQESSLAANAEYETGVTVPALLNTVIKAFLSLLGVIFIILIIYGGFIWMTAGGDEAKVTKAKGIIQRAVIGLFIIVISYALTWFVFDVVLGEI